MLMEKAMNHKIKLDEYEEKVENEIFNFISLSKEEKDKIEKIIDQENEKKSIKLRLRKYDLEKLKERARQEGIPYQTLLASLIHKFITDQLIDKRSILKGIQILKEGNMS